MKKELREKNTIKLRDNKYYLITRDHNEIEVKPWLEKSKDKWWIQLPKDNLSNRQYINKEYIDKSPTKEYHFDDRIAPPRELNSGWKSKLTNEEKIRLDKLEKEINDIKEKASKRIIDKNSPEFLMREIERYQELLKKARETKKNNQPETKKNNQPETKKNNQPETKKNNQPETKKK